MSMNGWPAAAVIFVSATMCPSFLLLLVPLFLLERGEKRVEPCVALVPERLVPGEPVRGVAQGLRLEVARARGGPPRPRDQARLLENLEVTRDRRLRHRKGCRELCDRQVARRLRQAGQDRPSRRVGERAEH